MNTPALAIQDAINWMMTHNVMLKATPGSSKHAAVSLTPATISEARFNALSESAPIFGQLINAVAENHQFLQEAIEPVAQGDAFFRELLAMHKAIHQKGNAKRTPLLMMRTDFMDDQELGPQLIEFNGIAAGMGRLGSVLMNFIAICKSNLQMRLATGTKTRMQNLSITWLSPV